MYINRLLKSYRNVIAREPLATVAISNRLIIGLRDCFAEFTLSLRRAAMTLPSTTRGEGRGLLNSSHAGRRGAALVLALLILALVTAMGVFAATRSSMDQRIASNSKDNTAAFFTAEGGIRHGMALLKSRMMADIAQPGTNATNISLGNSPTWTFLLTPTPATSYYCQGCDTGASTLYSGAWLTGGYTVVTRTYTQGNFDYNYSVYAWNNNEKWKGFAVSPTIDNDSTIFIRSVAVVYYTGTTNPAGPESIQEATIVANLGASIGMLSGLSQEFANEGKTSSAVDTREIAVGSLAGGATM